MRHKYWVWIEELDDYVIERIKDIGISQEFHKGIVGGTTPEDDNQRNSLVSWIRDKEVDGIVWDYINRANNIAFGFDIQRGFDVQYTRYLEKDKGFYNWHTDNNFTNEGFIDRKLSIVIQLTDPSEYEGGVFEFRKGKDFEKVEGLHKKGSVLVFPSFLEHRVTPVIKGERNSLVSWIEGPHFR